MAIKSHNKKLEDKTANNVNVGCISKTGGTLITETGLDFPKISLRLVKVKKVSRKIIFKVLTAISSFSQRDYAIGLQKLSKIQKENQISFKNTKTQSGIQKKHKRFFKDEYFVHWASFDCKSGLSLTEPRYEKRLVSR